MRLPVLKASNDVLPYIQEKYPVPILPVYFAKKRPVAHSNGPSTGEGLQGMMEGRDYCAAGTAYFALFGIQ